MEVIKAFMKTKENGRKHIQDVERMTEELQQYPCLYEKGNKRYKERDQKGNAWREVFNSTFMNSKGP